jgi:hypothetical protein
MTEYSLTFNDIVAGNFPVIATRTILADAANDRDAGTVLGKITASGKYVEYDDDGTDDGRRTAIAILLKDVPAGSSDTEAPVLLAGLVKRSALTGLDANGEEDLAGRGIHMDTENLS